MTLFGYALISIFDQDFGIQEKALRAAGCQTIRSEKKSGSERGSQVELRTLLDFLRAGDTLVVTWIDRLARSLKDLQDIVHDLKDRGISLKATEQPIDTGTAAGQAFLDMLGVVAEFETNLRCERQAEGIAAAKARGVYEEGRHGFMRKRSGSSPHPVCARHISAANSESCGIGIALLMSNCGEAHCAHAPTGIRSLPMFS